MSRNPMRKGWCPSLHAPMQTHDGWLVRVTPDLEGLSPAQLSFLAEMAARQGNGRITLTLRGNLQLRGFQEEAARRFALQAAEAGLGLADPQRESRRRVLFMSPLAGRDPACAPDTLALAREIEAAVTASGFDWHPPEKFGVVVDGGGLVPSGAMRADVMLRHESGSWVLHHGAVSQATDRQGAVALVMECLEASCRQRMEGRALHKASPFTGRRPALMGAFLPGCFGVEAVLGEISSQSCALLSATGATTRVTPWRGLILESRIEAADLMSDPQDLRRALIACPGEGSCHQALSPTRKDALSLAPALLGRSLHVSGCAKGCASRGQSNVTLVARETGYDLIWNGTVADRPVETGLGIEDVRRRLHRDDPAGKDRKEESRP
ncbi:hypothetical protein [Asaia spathodeae]|uniref:Nitrite/Sulfite reductase ferredoxin-like domain-containing protein n=1 Tax=Asaia spathodeae TaxID=657016 RepID=A0ABX2P6S8_9PROT|nr:hypothetical protein [Asaia spathodeae]GBR12031.1 cobalamin biosynthesis protein precorrin-3B biosynthesis protein [Asaia spathodeae NBRC 105894]